MKIQPVSVNHRVESEKVVSKTDSKIASKVPSKNKSPKPVQTEKHASSEIQITNNITINLNASSGFQHRGQHSFESGLLNLLQKLAHDRVIEEALRILDVQA